MTSDTSPEFKTSECQEFCCRVADGTHDSPKETKVGKKLVTSKNVKGGRLELDSAYLISAEDFYSINKRSKVDQWDLLLTMIGTVGEVCLVAEPKPNFAIKNVGLLKCGDELRAKWLYYFLSSPQGQTLIEERKKGSTQQYISLTDLRKLPISYPEDKRVMRSIVESLDVLDNRIALLRETNLTLEAMAQALFKSWFVDFDPVRSKSEGNLPEGMDEETAALFPNSFEQSDQGEIPEGWASNVIKELLSRPTISKRFTKSQVLTYGETPVYEQGASVLLGYHNDEPTFKASPENPMFIFGDHTCVTKLSCQPFDISQNVILLKGSIRNTIWTYYAIHGKQKFEEYRRHWMELIVKNVVVPPIAICNHFAEIVLPLQLSIEANEKAFQTLSDLRDTLLPRLISGQLRLPDAEEKIEAATA